MKKESYIVLRVIKEYGTKIGRCSDVACTPAAGSTCTCTCTHAHAHARARAHMSRVPAAGKEIGTERKDVRVHMCMCMSMPISICACECELSVHVHVICM